MWRNSFLEVVTLSLQANDPSATIAVMDNDVNLEKLKQKEDEVRGILDKWPKWKQVIAYRYLYNLEFRISNVDRIIREGLREWPE